MLHILCAIIGFGAVYLNALYGQQIRKRQGREGLADLRGELLRDGHRPVLHLRRVHLRLLARPRERRRVEVRPDVGVAGHALYLSLGVSHGVLLPAVKRMGVS